MAQKITCPVCFTKMNSVGHDLVCPSCGYKYCEGRQPYTYDDHNHNQYESYSQKTTYTSSIQGTSVYDRPVNTQGNNAYGRPVNAQGNSVYSRPVNAPGTSPIAPSTQSRPVASQSTVSKESQVRSETQKKSAKKIIVTIVTIYLVLACIPMLFEGVFFALNKNSTKRSFEIETEYEEESEEAILIFASNAQPKNFVQHFLHQAFQKELDEITTADCRQVTVLELSRDGDGIQANYCVRNSDGFYENNLFFDFAVIDFSDIGLLENLETLSVTANDVTNIDEIRDLTNLMHLELNFSSAVSDFHFLESLRKMEYLSLYAQGLDNLSFVNGMPNLWWLDVVCAPNLTDISPLRNCPRLESLDLSCDYGIKDFSPICSLSELQNLYLFGCGIDDVEWIAQIKTLRCLWLQNNHVTDLSPLAELPNLEELYCFGNDITNYGNLDRSIIKE